MVEKAEKASASVSHICLMEKIVSAQIRGALQSIIMAPFFERQVKQAS